MEIDNKQPLQDEKSDEKSDETPRVLWYLSNTFDCNYLPNRKARSKLAVVDPRNASHTYDSLITQGFRRSGVHIYQPACDTCKACVPVRVDVAEFKMNRSQKRTWRDVHDIAGMQAKVTPLRFDAEHAALYEAYLQTQHESTDDDIAVQYKDFLLRSPVNSHLVEFTLDGVLQAVSVIDQVSDGLSAVYTFYQPQSPYTLGKYAVLWQIHTAKELGLSHVYLGYWIAASRKMAYKADFQPLQILKDGAWEEFKASV